MNAIETKIARSAEVFQQVVWPEVAKTEFGGGEIVPVEAVTDQELALQLDQMAGIDAWHLMKNGRGVRGIASRVQISDGNPFDTFTIRYSRMTGRDTEWHKLKRITSGEDGAIAPHMHVHAYIDGWQTRNLLSWGVCKTKDLVDSMARTKQIRTNSADGTEFLWESFLSMCNNGYKCVWKNYVYGKSSANTLDSPAQAATLFP